MKKYQVIDEQIDIGSLFFEAETNSLRFFLERNPIAKRFDVNVKGRLDILLEMSMGHIDTALGGKIFINTIDRKKLAPEIVDMLKCWLGERELKNTEHYDIIKKHAESWLQSIEQETDTPTPNQYADFVLAKARDQFEPMTREQWGDDGYIDYEVYYRNAADEFSEKMSAIEEWAKMKREQPAAAQPDEPTQTFVLPPELDTPEARKYFERAIEKGYIESSPNGLKWTKTKAQLAYFCEKVFCPKPTDSFPETALNALFNVKRLLSSKTALYDAKKEPVWKNVIQSDIFY